MERWTPASKEDVQAAIREVADHAGAEVWSSYSRHLIEPYPVVLERFGKVEQVFLVARMPTRVVFFDDIEEDFGTAREVDGKLVDCAAYGDLRFALKEAEAGA